MSRYKKRIVTYLFMVVLFVPLWGRDCLHIFTSKGVYETCEDLGFKCVAFDDSKMLISDRSHTAYVEIIGPTDSVVWREKYRMSGGMCDGHAYVGNDWKPGEYRMFVYTRGSLGRGDTVVYPKRLLVVRELPEVPDYLSAAKERMQYIDIRDTIRNEGLIAMVTLDSTEYHTRSKVKVTVKVTDADGNPVRAVVVMSVADALYSYPPADVNIESQAYGILHDTVSASAPGFKPFLSDAAVSGHLSSGRKKNTMPLDGQYINVFDDMAEKGSLNVINTRTDGYFEISPDMATSLGRTLLLKPLVNEDMKPRLEFDRPFSEISEIRNKAEERIYPVLRRTGGNESTDTMDYSERHTVKLNEIIVKGKGSRFPKRNKVMGYLDSLALNLETAWICGCHGGYGSTYLNDYIEGYTHHPGGSGTPHKIEKPKRGVTYELIKYSGPTDKDYVVDIQYIEYKGPRYSEEELLRMNGLWKTEGYYTRHRFQLPSDEELIPGVEDFRNTLLWLPRAQTDENGEFTVEFPTSDIKSTFRITGFILMPDIRDAKTINEYFRVK
ncbi:MAG: hypothetical protein K2G77_02315 [Muribaculaceae bacterium]|nr:hypothetical protein [Muribaculaceae bacterium]